MGLLDRIGLLAKGKLKTWRKGASSPALDPAELERELNQVRPKTSPKPPREPDDEPTSDEPNDDYQRGKPDPENPKKRTL